MSSHSPAPVAVFHALAHDVRAAVVERLSHGPATVSELAEPHPIALPTFHRHLGVLEEAGVIRSEKRGRVRTCHLEADALAHAEAWLHDQRHVWDRRLDQLDSLLTTMGTAQAAPHPDPSKKTEAS